MNPSPGVHSPRSAFPDEPRRRLLSDLRALLDDLTACSRTLDVLEEMSPALEQLPLPINEYVLARNRLKRAVRYLRSEERGAARYELRLLLGQLRNAFFRHSDD